MIYIRPITSVQCREHLFEQLEKEIIKYRTMGEIIITGDFNERTFDFVIENDTSDR